MKRKNIFKELILEFQHQKVPEIIDRDINIPINTGKIISVIGVRRSGKTYILFQIIKKLIKDIPIEKIIYINFEDERLDIKSQELNLILEAYMELFPNNSLNNVYFFFDEIQNINGWEKFVRRLYDRYSKNIYITGSNSKLLSKEISTALRGRTISYEVFPLSFKEFLKFKNYSFKENEIYIPQKKALMKSLFNQYLNFGGFPEVVLQEDETIKIKILQEYFDVMLYKDLVERYKIKNIPVLKYFIKRTIENVGKPLSVNNIYNEIKSQGYKVSKDSLYEFLEMLESIYLIFTVRKFSKSVLKTELSQKKVYLIDNGFLNALSFSFKENKGALLENLTAKEFKTYEGEIFYFKEKKECDFITVIKSKFIPVQVSYVLKNKKTLKREIDGLLEAMKYLNARNGYIITYDEEDQLNIENKTIQIIPAYKFIFKSQNSLK